MEVSASAITTPVRIALQVISQRKRPQLEVYFEILHRSIHREHPGSGGAPVLGTRHQEIDAPFQLVNIGGSRATGVRLELAGNLDRGARGKLSDLPIFAGVAIPQLAPAQRFHLFTLRLGDIERIKSADQDPAPIKIVARYDGARTGLGRLHYWWMLKIRRKSSEYESEFRFEPKILWTDLPPAEYV